MSLEWALCVLGVWVVACGGTAPDAGPLDDCAIACDGVAGCGACASRCRQFADSQVCGAEHAAYWSCAASVDALACGPDQSLVTSDAARVAEPCATEIEALDRCSCERDPSVNCVR